MPNFTHLALRYLAWLIGLRILFSIAVQGFGLPNLPSMGVIFAALPAVDVGRVALKQATAPLSLGVWGKIWGLCIAIFAAIQIILPAILFASMREIMASPQYLSVTAIVLAATGAMIALFLWIGSRIKA